MTFDDESQIDPATLPDSLKLLEQLEALDQPAPVPLSAPATGDMRDLVSEATHVAVACLPEALEARAADHPLEEDLRAALVSALSRTNAVVLTEAKLSVKGWPANLGGFDIALSGVDGSMILVETKWGNVWQGIWDILKLAGGHQHQRVSATYAAYAATPGEWNKYTERDVFVLDTRASVTEYLLEQYETEWAWNLEGSPNVRPTTLPAGVILTGVHAEKVVLLGREYEVRVVSVEAASGPRLPLTRGVPDTT